MTRIADPGTATLDASVVIPTFRRADLVVRAVESALAQSRQAREVIVVDDGSPDDTAAALAPFVESGRVQLVRQANAGLSVARNAGARRARGAALLFLDDDDLLYPDALARLAEELDRFPEAAFAYGACVPFDGDAPAPPRRPDASAPASLVAFLQWNRIHTAGQVLMRRAAFDAVGGFDATLSGTADWDLWLALLERYEGRAVPRAVLAYRLHAGMSSDVAHMYLGSARVARRHLARVEPSLRPALRALSARALREWHAPRLLDMARAAADARSGGRAARAVAAWGRSWLADVGARAMLKAALVRRGRWRLSTAEPRFAVLAPLLGQAAGSPDAVGAGGAGRVSA